MIKNEISEKIVSITFVIAVMITAIGWLGINKNKKKYLILWIAIIPLIFSSVFSFFTKNYYDNILLISVLMISYLIYIGFLIVSTYRFIKIKDKKEINNKQVENTIDLIKNKIL
ncbi:hypothetical protein [Spiroplasma ixodetis]|uniref:Transmembrane protein n=1 Tax=Spiroplasma ixodetis TaxID=2141 RepID=A0ABM8BSS6_9MOLU|nr:hypothetical protein [Spiroplasma ixodetis]BDT02903.1 hypothetical protein SHM_05490 [Spiroplasma ixodetis]